MNKLAEKMLTDRSARNADAMKKVALSESSEMFAPWAG